MPKNPNSYQAKINRFFPILGLFQQPR